jgi:Protein of unknown function (DUF3040)
LQFARPLDGVNVLYGCAERSPSTPEGVLGMSLSPDEQRLLEGIESGLWFDDPTLPEKLNFQPEEHFRRCQVGYAHALLWLGMSLALTGYGVVHEVLAVGVLLIFSGFGFLALAGGRLRQFRPPGLKTPRHPS